MSNKDAVLVIAVEAYAEAESVNTHAEANQRSLSQGTSLYNPALHVGFFKVADGYGDKVKLNFKPSTTNILSILSMPLYGYRAADCGSSMSIVATI
ncbi:hypothetical protein BDF20DRAFT_998082 [Mycotypha africana]|uniref:uncharacterized protein n=1 Tax=Mycotypha africana TaxID=64632 RepID=UPI0022FFE57C|nr:uncharacterized protein BDF20DRAFT_998082 [Mycotypha africana]KAI8987429.1 hypothetical protein BDF20DRAFT_998082 [Mycotypha africana]